MSAPEQNGTSSKKTRGRPRGHGKKSLALIEAMYTIVEAAQPITGRGVGYKLFVRGLIPSMKTSDMKTVYRLLKEAREQGIIPWDWIVDESRQLEKRASWDDPDDFVQTMINNYRREYWNSSRCASKSGPRRERCAAFFAPCLMNTALGSGWSTASRARRLSTTLP